MIQTRTKLVVALTMSVTVLAVILAISPQTTTVANEASGDIYGIDILGITRNAGSVPEQQIPAP